MKSFFTKLGKLLLCGVAVAVVGCTDYDTDIQNVNNRLDELEQTTAADLDDLKKYCDDLFATQAALNSAKSELSAEIDSEIANLENTLKAAINQKADKADVEAAIKTATEAITALQTELANAKAALTAEINKKADQTALDAAVARIEALETNVAGLLTDVESLKTIVMQHEYLITNLTSAFNTFQEQTTEKIALIEADQAAFEAYVDTTVEEIYGKIDVVETALSAVERLLKEEVERLDIADEALWEKINLLETSITNLNNLLDDEAAERKAEDEELQKGINAVADNLSAVINTMNDYKTALDAKDAELANEIDQVVLTVNTLTETLSATIQNVSDLTATVTGHIAAFEAYKKELDATIETLKQISMDHTAAITNHETAIQNLTDRVEGAEINIAKLVAENAEIKMNIANIIETITNHAGSIEKINGDIEDIQTENAAIKEEVARLVETITNHAGSIQKLNGDVEDLLATDAAIQKSIEELVLAVTNLDMANLATQEAIEDLKADFNNELNQLQQEVTTLNAMLAQVNASISVDIKKLMNQVQSLVYVPEYDDHKATLDFAKVGRNNYIPAVSTLRYVVKSNGVTAEDLAKAYLADNTILSYLTKEVEVRTKAEAAAELEIVKVYADKEGYLCVDVLAKNFDPAFYTKEASYSVALALVQAEETNNLTSEYTNLVPAAAPKHKASFCVQTLFEGKDKPQSVESNASGNLCIIQRNGFIATNDTETVYKTTSGVPGLVIDNKFYNEEELLEEFGYAIDVHRSYRTATHKKNGEYYVNITLPDLDYHDDLYMLDKKNFISNPSEGNADNKVISLTEVPSTEQTGRVGMYTVVEYSYGLGDIYITNKYTVTIANKVVSYDVPAVVVPWTMGLADSLSVVTENATRELYAADLVRNAPYTTPEDFEGFTLHSIVQTGETLKREVTFNGVATTDVDIQASIKDSHVVLTLINASEKGYAFPEHDAENEYNEYKITWIKEHESVTATVTATLLLGKKPAPVAVPMEDVTLQLIGKKANYYTAPVDFVQAAYDKFAELGLLGYADVKAGEAAFKAAFEVADPSDANNNTVTVNGSKGSYNNVSYANSLIRFYNNNVYAADGQNYVSQVNNLWFEVPFTFTVKGILDEPSYGLVFSQADFVTPENETYGKVEVDGDIVNNVFTIDQADLAKYFEVSNDVDNDNDLTVKFIVTTKDAPKPETTDVVAVNPVEGYNNLVLATNEAVIKDWTNGGKFVLNNIVVEAVLMANGTFELDRKTVELYTPDPLEIATETLFVTRYPGKDAVAKTYGSDEFGHYGLTITSTEEEGNLVNVGAWTSKGIFHNSHADVTYGAKFVDIDGNVIETNAPVLKRVYVEDAEGNVVEENYNPLKYQLVDGTFTVFAEDAILKNTIVAEVEYRFTHNFNYGNVDVKTVVVKFVPASADEYAL